MSLSKWAEKLEEKHKVKSIQSISYERISTGNIVSDYLLEFGGWARNKINEVFGWQGSGKTTQALMTAAWVQKYLGKAVLYIDSEFSLNLDYADKLGVDRSENIWCHVQQNDCEIVGKIIKSALLSSEQNNLGLIILDSAASVNVGISDPDAPKSEQFKEAIAERARFWSTILTEITNLVATHEITFLFVNQVRQNIAAGKYATESEKEHATGGNALEFYKVVSLKMDSKKLNKTDGKDDLTGDKKYEAIGKWINIKVIKDKASGKEGSMHEAYIKFGDGFDNTQVATKILLNKGILEKESGAYQVKLASGQTLKARDIETLEQILAENPEFTNAELKKVGFVHDYIFRRT